MKNSRQEKILELIKRYEISTQEALIEKLRKEGFDVTQTTVSRDIRQLNLVKGQISGGGYKYVEPESHIRPKTPVHTSSLSDSVLKVEAAQNIVVIKTHAGMANAIAVCIEDLHLDGLVGSVAGDDTMIMVFKDNEKADLGEAQLSRMFKH